MAGLGITQDWALPWGKDITNFFKGIAELITRTAEPIMRYATVYLAIATALPALKLPALYDAGMTIVIASPEFVLVGALSIAEAGWKEGRKFWSIVLFCVCGSLAIIMITTFTEIFKITTMGDGGNNVLNFARCIVAAAFSVVLPKLDGVTSQNVPVQIPDLDQLLTNQREQILSEIAASLNAFRAEIATQIDSRMVAPEPLDYSQVAQQMKPTLDQFYAEIFTRVDFQLGNFETLMMARIPPALDMAMLASHVAPLVSAMRTDETANVAEGETDNDTPDETAKPRITAKLTDLPVQRTRNTDQLKMVSRRQARKSSTEANELATKMKRIVKRYPSIGPTELATKAGVSKSTASRFLRNMTTVA